MIAVDVEASGTNPYKHSIVSVGAVDMADPTSRFYAECRIWDGAHIMDEALAVCGYSREEVTDINKQSEAEVAHKFMAWALSKEERTIVGQNPSFDRDFLQNACTRAHLDWPLAYRTIDCHSLCYMHYVKRGLPIPTMNGRSGLDLDAVLRYCGIPEEPNPHNALTGAMCHAEVTSRLLYDKKFLPEFNEFEIPWL